MSKITKIWIDEWHNNEYYSKRNLRPKRPFEIRTERMDRCDEYFDIKGQQGMPKLMRYEFRSVYGSKY